MVLNDLALIGMRNRRLLIGWVRQLLLIARREIGVPHRIQRCLQASAEQQCDRKRYDSPQHLRDLSCVAPYLLRSAFWSQQAVGICQPDTYRLERQRER